MTRKPHRARAELFRSDAVEAAFAYFLALPEEDKREFHTEATQLLHATNEPSHTQTFRVREAIRGLVEAEASLGHPPSISEYTELSNAHPEWDWRTVRTAKRWLGAKTWNDALKRAGIATTPDPDHGEVLSYELGDPITPAEVIAALKECAAEIGHVPLQAEYVWWAHRPEVRRRPGRRPRGYQTVRRRFGSWSHALVAAHLIDKPLSAPLPNTIQYKRDELLDALREVTARLDGRSPRIYEYKEQRVRIASEAEARGEVRVLPADETIRKHLGQWDHALIAAGLEPVSDRKRLRRRHGTRGIAHRSMWPRTACVAALREAQSELGHPISAAKYSAWRMFEVERDPRRAYELPSHHTIRRYFDSWPAAALEASKENDD